MNHCTTPCAIPTIVHGVHYRSRLEARWAWFWDTIGVQHRYEPRTFAVRTATGYTKSYTPDFELFYDGVSTAYLEIKPSGVDLSIEPNVWKFTAVRKQNPTQTFALIAGTPESHDIQVGGAWGWSLCAPTAEIIAVVSPSGQLLPIARSGAGVDAFCLSDMAGCCSRMAVA